MCAQLGAQDEAASKLLALAEVVNQAVGDALSGLLLVEAALARRAWGLREGAALYADLPSRQLKARTLLLGALLAGEGHGHAHGTVLEPDLPSGRAACQCTARACCDAPVCMLAQVRVADRSIVRTADAERRAVAPAGLQGLINAAVAAAPSGEPHGLGWASAQALPQRMTCAALLHPVLVSEELR